MSRGRPLRSSPVMFGRDELLALGRQRLGRAIDGDGGLLFLAGEAGIGKTRLLDVVHRAAVDLGVHVVTAAVFPGDLELSGGLLLDLAHELSRSAVPGAAECGAAIAAALSLGASGHGDAHRRRRLMVLEIVDRLAGLTAAGTTLLAFEDLHWADDLTLEVLSQLARRLNELRMLVVGTYRDDELFPRVPLREWRSRLITQRLADEVQLRRLTFDEVSSMTTLLLGGSTRAPAQLVDLLLERSNGIPLHIEELIGAGAPADPAAMPDSLRDAIRQRRAELSELAVEVANAAAVIGRSFQLEALAAVADRPLEDVARGIDELLEREFISAAAGQGWYDFRHALIREALEDAAPLASRRQLHARAAAAADLPGMGGPAVRSAHYEAAGDRDAAHSQALVAAERAVAVSNHREALALYHRAMRCAPADLDNEALAALLVARAAEAVATDENAAAAADYARAHALLLEAGQAVEAADVLPSLAATRHLLGDSLEQRLELLEQGLTGLSKADLSKAGLPAERTAPVRARLHAGISAAYMLDRRLDESIAHGEQALVLADAAGDEVTELDTSTTVGSVLLFAGQGDAGWARLEDAIRRGRLRRWERETARAYRMIGTSASVLVEYDRAERWLPEGIDYAGRTEQWNHRHYMAASLGHVLWATGRPDEAAEVTERAMADGRGGLTTRIVALHVRGFLALGRGDTAAALDALGEARAIGSRMGELQRLSPAVWGLAEVALFERRWSDAVALCFEGRAASERVHDAAYLWPFLLTGTRALLQLGDPGRAATWVAEVTSSVLERSIPGTLPAIDHARGLLHMSTGATGAARSELTAARAGWLARRRAWEGAWAALDLALCAYRSNRAAEAVSLLATVGLDAPAGPLARGAADLGAMVHRRRSTEVAWAPLTAREFEVAQLIAAGRTNREIAIALHITAKTAGTHVEHILTKLGARRRAEVAAWVVSVRPT